MRDPQNMCDSVRAGAPSEGTRFSEHSEKLQPERAFRGYATIGARGMASEWEFIPTVDDPRRMRDNLKVEMHSDGTQPSEHAGRLQTGRTFRGYATLGACGIASG